MASLFVVRGRDQGRHFPLDLTPTRIGRDAACDIRLLDSEASRTHAELRPDRGGRFQLVDLQSSNGTLVNGDPIVERWLVSGDRIEIGGTLLIFTGAGQSGSTSGESGRAAGRPRHDVEIVPQTAVDDQTIRGDASRIISSVAGAAAFESTSRGRQLQSDRNLELMYLTALAVGRTDNLSDLLDRVLRLVFDWVDADRGCVMLRDGDSDRLRPAARCDRDNDRLASRRQERIAISRTILDYVVERKEGVRTSDARDDSRFDAAHSIVQGGVREALCVPLQGRYAVVGALYVDTFTPPGVILQSGYQARFNDEHLRLMTAIGYQAALAIEDTYYYSAMMQSERLAAMGQTIATLSHHIKNILQGMRGGSFLIDAGLKREDTDAVRRGWAIVERNQERISNLVMDMLTFSKEREPEKVDADLNETVSDVVELMRSRAQELGVQLQLVAEPAVPLAPFDPEALHRALLNIVTNAIDAAADGARDDDPGTAVGGATDGDDDDSLVEPICAPPAADVAHQAGGDHRADRGIDPPAVCVATGYVATEGWLIAVSDNGKGIDAADRERIFSVFESKKGARGTGLGLPVSDKIMREHGGGIEIVDQVPAGLAAVNRPDRGICFVLRLPPSDTGATFEGIRGTHTF